MKDTLTEFEKENEELIREYEETISKATLYQVDNLLQFLNDVEDAGDIPVILGLEESDPVFQVSADILEHRNENGPYIALGDLLSVESLTAGMMADMLGNARHPLLQADPALVMGIPYGTEASLVLGFGLDGIYFKLKWPKRPPEWAGIDGLTGLVEEKFDILESRYKKAKEVVKALEKALELLESSGDEDRIEAKKEEVKDAKGVRQEAKREVKELMKAIREADLKTVWNIVKKNMEAVVAKLKAELKSVEGKNPQNMAEYDKRKKKIKELNTEISERESQIQNTDTAVNSHLSPSPGGQ